MITERVVDLNLANQVLTFFYALVKEAAAFGAAEQSYDQNNPRNKSSYHQYFELIGASHRVEAQVFNHNYLVILSFYYRNTHGGILAIHSNGVIDFHYAPDNTFPEGAAIGKWTQLALDLGRQRVFFLPERVLYGWVNTKTRQVTTLILGDKQILCGRETTFCLTPYVLQSTKLPRPLEFSTTLNDNTVAEWLSRFWRAVKQGRIVRLASRAHYFPAPIKAHWEGAAHYLQFGGNDSLLPAISTQPYMFRALHSRMLFLASAMEGHRSGLHCVKQNPDDIRRWLAPK